MQDDISDFEDDDRDGELHSELDDLELPDDIDPSEMAESIEDELIAEEGEDIGLDRARHEGFDIDSHGAPMLSDRLPTLRHK